VSPSLCSSLDVEGCLTARPNNTCKGKAIPLQAWAGPEGSSRLRLPDFKTISTFRWYVRQPYAPAAFTPPGIIPGTLSQPQGLVRPKDYVIKNSSDTIGNQTRDPPACSTAPKSNAPLRTPNNTSTQLNKKENERCRTLRCDVV
jgi:hypothetical protein